MAIFTEAPSDKRSFITTRLQFYYHETVVSKASYNPLFQAIPDRDQMFRYFL